MPKITWMNDHSSMNDVTSVQVPCGSDFQQIIEYYPEVPIKFGCRNAECGVCAIQIVKGQEHLTKVGSKEQKTLMRKGFPPECRLACQCAINGDVCFKSKILHPRVS